MKNNKRYGGLILLLAIFLAFRPASALCVRAAERNAFRDRSDRVEQMLPAGRDVFGIEDTSPKTSPETSQETSGKTFPKTSPKTSQETSGKTFPKTSPKTSQETSGKTSPKTSSKTSQETSREISGKASGKEIELPQFIKDYHFDADTEKKRLAEAISKLDELGFSPEKLAQRFWSIISRKENREKIGKAAEELKENTGKLIEKASGAGTDSESGKDKAGKGDSGKGDSGKDDFGKGDSGDGGSSKDKSQKDESQRDESGKGDSEDSRSGNDGDVQIRKGQDSPLYEKAADAVDQVKEKVREEASKKVEEAIDQAAEAAGDYAVKEINETAEKVKEEVR